MIIPSAYHKEKTEGEDICLRRKLKRESLN